MARKALKPAARARAAGTVTTFYSFKGGVGRTFILANVAWLLARWGRRVLCLDWDLEAPGLHRYLAPSAPPRDGVLDLLRRLHASDTAEWRQAVDPVSGPWTGKGALDLIGAGRRDTEYFDRLQALDSPDLFDAGLSPKLEKMRAEWTASYDHVLLDARTGVTDVGGICASQLPDLLVMVFTATHQSLEGTVEVATRAERTRRTLPLDRGGFHCIPVPARIHSGEESLLEQEWFGRFEQQLAPLCDPWKDRTVEVREYLQHLRVREYARWSFGEQLPVRDERLDDPLLVSWAFANLAALIDQRLVNSGSLTRHRQAYVQASATPGLGASSGDNRKSIDVFISHAMADKASAVELHENLAARGLHVYLDEVSLRPGDDFLETLYRAREESRMIVVLLSGHSGRAKGQIDELEHVVRLAREQSTTIVPIFLDKAGFEAAPQDIQRRFGMFHQAGESWDTVVTQIFRTLTS